MSEIVLVDLIKIDPNPMRKLVDYPFSERKLETLKQSIADVGLWEGIIVRKKGKRFQMAFGHHRHEAARLYGEKKVPVIVRELTDEQMIQFMGRENLEDYNADFLIMLESWDAAKEFLRLGGEKIQPLDIASLLGWVRVHSQGQLALKRVAEACDSASKLISGGYLVRDDLEDISVRSVREICQSIVTKQRAMDEMAKTTGRPKSETERAKKVYGKAGSQVARDVREGRVAKRDIRGRVETEAYEIARHQKKKSPLFEKFGKDLADSISRMLNSDTANEKLEQIQSSLNDIMLDDDLSIVERLGFECNQLSKRALKWERSLIAPQQKVVKLKQIK